MPVQRERESASWLHCPVVLRRKPIRGERRWLDRRARGECDVLQTTAATGEASCRIAVCRWGRRDFPTDGTREDEFGLIRHAARVYQLMQAANLRNRDGLAQRRCLHVTRRRRVAIQRQMWAGAVIVPQVGQFGQSRDSNTQKMRSRGRSFARLTDCLNTATCCRSARFSMAVAARPRNT